MLESRPSSCLCRMKQTRLGWVRLSSKAKYERYENCHLVLVVVAGNSWTRGPPIVWLWWSTLSAWWLLKISELEIPSQVLNKNTSFLFFPLRKLCANSRTRCANCAPYGLSGNTGTNTRLVCTHLNAFFCVEFKYRQDENLNFWKFLKTNFVLSSASNNDMERVNISQVW